MRIEIGIIALLLVSGCVNTGMNAAEIAACVHTTKTQIVDIPNCQTNEECVAAWKKTVDVPTFHHFPVKKEMVEIQHHIVQAWNSLREAQTLLGKANAACEKGNIASVIQHGLPAAGSLQNALQSTEKSHWAALAALHSTAEIASHEELERIKDTKLYAKYANALEILHNVATGNETNEWGREWGKNQAYYTEIGQQISNQPLPSASFDWKDTFAWYDTGVGIAYPEKKKTIIWFSTIWKSALTSLTKGKAKNKAITLMQAIQAEQMMQSVEVSTSPANGLVVQVVSLIADMEKEWQSIEKMENEKGIELKTRVLQLQAEQEDAWVEEGKKQTQWEGLQPFFHTYSIQAAWKKEAGINDQLIIDELENAIQSAIKKNEPLGRRIERIRKIEKWINDWEKSIIQQEETNQLFEDACEVLHEKMGMEKIMGESPCAELQAVIEMDEWKDEEGLALEIKLSACVEEVNLLQTALGGDSVEPEQFMVEFGPEAALAGCESMMMALENHYAQDPLTQTWMKEWEELQWKKDALIHASHGFPEYYKLDAEWTNESEKIGSTPPTLTPEEAETYLLTLEELNGAIEQALREGLQKQIEENTWKVNTPQPMGLGEMDAEAEFHISNPFGQSVVLNGPFYIQTPILDFTLEDELLSNIDGIIEIEEISIPKTGLTLKGAGKGEWSTLSTQTSIKQVIGDEAAIEAVLSIQTAATSPSMEWKWKTIGGIISPPIQGKMDGKNIQVNHSNTEMSGIIPIDELLEEITLLFTQKGIMDVKTILLKQEEDQGVVNEWYDVTITNTTEYPYSTTIKTGIITPFAGTYTILPLDASGKPVQYSIGVLSDIILQNVEMGPMSTKTVSILLSKEGEEESSFIQEVLEEEINHWMENENPLIAAEAQKLWSKIHTNTNPEKWPTLAQEVMQLKENGEKSGEKIEPTPVIQSNLIEEQPSSGYIEKMHASMQNAKEKMGQYEKMLGISCTKLVETGYYCPLDEKTLKEWKKEWETDAKKEGAMSKRAVAEKTTREQKSLDEEQATKISKKWELRTQNTRDAIEEVEKTARGLEAGLKEQTQQDTREDVKGAWEKFKQAIKDEEFGKAIFIGKNLRQYFASENRISGLISIPPAGWPLIGIIVLVGGFFIRKEWKKKKIEPVELKPLPEANGKTSPPRAPHDSGGSSPPRTRGEYR